MDLPENADDRSIDRVLVRSSLPSETSFACEVLLPETEMRTVKTAVYFPGAHAHSAQDVPAGESSSSHSGQELLRSSWDRGRKKSIKGETN